jgi:hypothetical protein
MTDRHREADHDRIASAVFEVVLDDYPALMSIEEVIREVASDPVDFGDRNDITNAIRDLTKEGLLHRCGEFVLATRAAVRATELCI